MLLNILSLIIGGLGIGGLITFFVTRHDTKKGLENCEKLPKPAKKARNRVETPLGTNQSCSYFGELFTTCCGQYGNRNLHSYLPYKAQHNHLTQEFLFRQLRSWPFYKRDHN